MVRYASRAPSVDHQWASYVNSISSVLKDCACYCLPERPPTWPSLWSSDWFCGFSQCGLYGNWHPSYLHRSNRRGHSPHAAADRRWWGATVCWPHSACSKYLRRTRRPGKSSGDRRCQFIITGSSVAGFVSGSTNRAQDATQDWANRRPARMHEREPMHPSSQVNMLHMSNSKAAKVIYTEDRAN